MIPIESNHQGVAQKNENLHHRHGVPVMNTQRDSLDRTQQPFYARSLFRTVTGVLGLFLLGLGVYVLMWPAASGLLAKAAGVVLVLLGGNAVLAAWHGKRAWLARIGPLP